MSAKQKADRGTWLKVLRYLKPYWALILLSIALSAVTVALTLYVPVLIGRVVDQIIGPGRVLFQQVASLLVRIGIIVLITAAVQWIVNTTETGAEAMVDEIQMRSKAVVSGIPITTTLAALTSTVEGLMDKHDFGRFEVCSLQEWHRHVLK